MSKLVLPVGPGDHIRGDPNALVTLVEYGDYECPSCGRAHPIVLEVLRRLAGDMRFVFRHFPLAQVHAHALLAAEAAEAAGGQGKFWPMHDTLFEHQDALGMDDLIGYVRALGLDRAQFAHDLKIHAYQERVKRDVRSGARSGVNVTPAFFIEGVRFEGSWDADGLSAAVQAALVAKAA